ncbi:MAG: tyrosine-type recombinase/integrase [Deltaproteobacteria bacterium]|nr:tyrosine-type recombinase/integrase [Deltaproteobacteria bacterium]
MARVTAPKHGANYRIEGEYIRGLFYSDGKRITRALCSVREVAYSAGGKKRTARQMDDAIQRVWEAKLADLNKASPGFCDASMKTVFTDWIDAGRAAGRKEATLQIHRLARDYYLDIVGDHQVEEPIGNPPRPGYDVRRSSKFIEGLRSKGLGAVRINVFISRLGSALRHAYDANILYRLPKLPRLKEQRLQPRVPSLGQVKAMLQRLTELSETWPDPAQRKSYGLHRLLLLLLLGTGIRRGEAYYLERSHVFLDERLITLVTTKTGQPRIVRIPVFLRSELERHFKDTPGARWVFEHPSQPGRQAWANPRGMSTAFRRHMAALGFPGEFKALHGFRALFASAGLNQVGVAAEAMKAQLGHAALETTLGHYVSSLDEAQLRAVDDMESRFFTDLLERKVSEKPKILN